MTMTRREEPTQQPERAIVGHCPECARVVILCNNHESWPLVVCHCGWEGGTDGIVNRVRVENGGRIVDQQHSDF